MKSLVFLALIFWLPFQAGSQTRINYYEYWFDDQFQNRIIANLSPSAEFKLNQNIQTGNLTAGLHQVHIRFRDNNGLYSSLTSQTFIKLPASHFTERTIIAYEYWFDDKYSEKSHQAISPTNELKLITNLNTNSIQPGLHQVHIRFKDDIHQWSSVSSQTIIKLKDSDFAERNIVAFEYWIDDDYNSKTFQNIAPNNNLVLLDNLTTGNINNGLHQIHIRFKDDINQWSSLTSQVFIKIDPSAFTDRKVNEVEYWFDNDYANKINDTVAPENNLNYIRNINTDLLSYGLHHLHIRFRDDIHQWSSLQSQIFVKTNQAHIPNFVNGYRYWIDHDTSSIINVDLPITTNPKYLLTDLNLANLDTGTHTIALQFRDLNGLWSQVILDTFYQLGEPRLDYVNPAKVGNSGYVTLNLFGTGFYKGLIVKLSQPGIGSIESIFDKNIIINGTTIITTFNLNGLMPGLYDIEVILPTNSILKLHKGLEVFEGKNPFVYTNIIGPNFVRPNQFQNFTAVVGNNGHIDAIGVPFWITVPPDSEVEYDFPITNPYDKSFNYDTIDNTLVLDSIWNQASNSKVRGFMVSKIPPNQVKTFNFKVKTSSFPSYQLNSWVNEPVYDNEDKFNDLEHECEKLLVKKIVVTSSPSDIKCFYKAYDNIVTIWKDSPWGDYLVGEGTSRSDFGELEYILDYSRSLGSMALSCLTFAFKTKGGLKTAVEAWQASKTFTDINRECDQFIDPSLKINRKNISVIQSIDPNNKFGPVGKGSENYINNNIPIHYIINFENMDTATAAAQTVCIIDTIDINKFDINSYSNGFIKIADTIVYIQAHIKEYNKLIDLRPRLNYVVNVHFKLNETNGVAKWTFTTLDPETLLEITDPLGGFLPPNVNKPEGEGSVFYTIRVKEDIPNETEIKNTACIIFDNNPSICTNTWRNTIDKELPTSFVKALPPEIGDTTFQVCWQGLDSTSGIQNYDIFYSRNDGPFLPWLLSTADTCSMFTGQIDSTYQFYSIARDSAGNSEIPPVGYDAITKISCLMPEFICPENIVKAQTPGFCGSQIFFEVDITEDCAQISISQTQGLPNGSFYPVGKTINKFIATDRSGNTLSCRFTVTIKDTIAPKFNCPPNVQLITKPLECFANYAKSSLGSLTQLSDNCPWIKPNTDISTLVISNNALTTYPLGITNVLWTVTDSSGNKNTCKQTVTVNPYTCGTPYQPLTISTTSSTGKVSWKAGFCANEYNARIRPEISTGVYGNWSNWTPTSGPGLTHTFVGLARNKNYNYQLRTKCGNSYSGNANGFFKTKVAVQNEELQSRENESEFGENPVQKITLIPNPASTETTLLIQGFETSTKMLYIIDSNGKLILRTKLQAEDNNLMLNLQELGLASGIYHIRIDNTAAKCTNILVVE